MLLLLLLMFGWGIGIAIALAVFMLVLGGVQYMTTDAVFNKELGKTKKARLNMLWEQGFYYSLEHL